MVRLIFPIGKYLYCGGASYIGNSNMPHLAKARCSDYQDTSATSPASINNNIA
jgi:hypothetical protein